ncbi:hypothetical protein F1559_000976 [Cyanidiococcus yangmingshanensis]|uniref:Uncharacterized protein n=1 Tax=Cyanidiococcus yangmingshanensis TaxID=2690220 RepID=A0A7J7ID26_9RHOD|nr:hypothetical protein F1559_000976 [Cyanidiococcus yangmingshanensis]
MNPARFVTRSARARRSALGWCATSKTHHHQRLLEIRFHASISTVCEHHLRPYSQSIASSAYMASAWSMIGAFASEIESDERTFISIRLGSLRSSHGIRTDRSTRSG